MDSDCVAGYAECITAKRIGGADGRPLYYLALRYWNAKNQRAVVTQFCTVQEEKWSVGGVEILTKDGDMDAVHEQLIAAIDVVTYKPW